MKIYIKSLWKLIKSNISRFITLVLIVFLGIGFLIGVFGTAPDLEKSVSTYFHESNVSEIYIATTTGILNEDVTYIENIYKDYNPTLRKTYEVDDYINVNNLTRVAHIVYTDLKSNNTDKLELISGNFPTNENEVVVERAGNYLMNISIGSTIKIEDKEYKVSGIVANPWYLMKERYDSNTINASLDTIVYLPIDYYLNTILNEEDYLYTNVYLYFGLEDDVFSSSFTDETEKLLKILQDSDFENNHNQVFKKYLERQAFNSNEYKENYQKAYDEALEIAISEAYDQAYTLAYDEAIIEFLSQMYNSNFGNFLPTLIGKTEEEAIDAYNNGEDIVIDASFVGINLTINKTKVQEQFRNKTGDIYDFDISKFGLAEEGTTLGEQIDSDVIPKVEEGINASLDTEIIPRVTEEVTNILNEETLKAVDEEYNELEKEVYYLDALDNYSTSFYKMNVDKVNEVAIIFPIFFFIIASLVALTSLRRLVFEERVTMGTLRALGYSKFAVMMRYVIYGVLASTIGSVLGICLGIALIPFVIYNIFNSTCHMPPLIYVYDTPFISTVILVMIFVIILVVIFSVIGTLRETPANLLIPKAPKPGGRIFLEKISFIWQRLSFKYKSSIRNMIRYKRNLIMMIIGVGGCTALLLLAFGLQDSMDAVSNKQYDSIILYDALAAPKDELTRLNNENITKQYSIYYDTFSNDDYTVKVISGDDSLNEYFGFYVKNQKYEFTSNDVLISKMYSDVFDLDVGDNITYKNNSYKITGIFENYIDNYLFIGNDVANFTNNRILLNFTDVDERTLTDNLISTNQIVSIEYVSSMRTAYNSLINNITLIVAVIIIFAAILAVIVIFNLLNINVSERKRELATLKVLGYRNTEIHGYMARESFTLTAIGLLIGIGVGVILHKMVCGIIDTNTLMAGRTIKWQSYIYASLLTIIFSVVVDLSFIPYYRKISMTDSLKAIE